MGVKRAASKISLANLDGGHFPESLVDLHDQVFGVGLHVATILLAAFYLTVVHAVMVWVATQDPQMTVLYVRSLGRRDFYPPHASVHGAGLPVHPSIPQGR